MPWNKCSMTNNMFDRFIELQIETFAKDNNSLKNVKQCGQIATLLRPMNWISMRGGISSFLPSFARDLLSSQTQSTPFKSRMTLSHFSVTPDVDGATTLRGTLLSAMTSSLLPCLGLYKINQRNEANEE